MSKVVQSPDIADEFKARVSQWLDTMICSAALSPGAGATLSIRSNGPSIEASFHNTVSFQIPEQFSANDVESSAIVGVALVGEPGKHRFVWIDENDQEIEKPSPEYFDKHPVFSQVVPEIVDDQHMVQVPKFYVRARIIAVGKLEGCTSWTISPKPRPGFRLHTAFASPNHSDGAPCFYVGQFQASVVDEMLSSQPGGMPARNQSLLQFEKLASQRNRNEQTGWQQWDASQLGAIRWLYLVEKGTLDCQSETGKGRTQADGIAKVDAPDVAEAAYRGITGLWGNVWQWLGGLKTVDGEVMFEDPMRPGNWIATGHKPIANTYYLKNFALSGALADFFIAGDQATDRQSEALCPHLHFFDDDGEFFPFVGGLWSDASGAGLWALFVNGAASDTSAALGARLAKRV